MLNLEHLNIFINAAQLGSFSAAARKLDKGVTTIGVTVAKLEDSLGVELFDRSGNLATLTPAGERILEMASQLHWQAGRVETSVTNISGRAETSLNIGLGDMVPVSLLSPVLPELQSQFPATQLNLIRRSSQQLLDRLESREIDICIIAADAFNRSGSDFFHIANIELITVCSPDSELLDEPVVDLEKLALNRQLMSADQVANPTLASECTIAGEIWTISRMDDLLRLVEQDLGWAIVPKAAAESRVAMGTLQQFYCDVECVNTTYSVELKLQPSLQYGPVLSCLIDVLCRGQLL